MYFLTCKDEFLSQLVFNLMNFSNVPNYEKSFSLFVFTNIYCVSTGISTLMSISDGLPRIFSVKR